MDPGPAPARPQIDPGWPQSGPNSTGVTGCGDFVGRGDLMGSGDPMGYGDSMGRGDIMGRGDHMGGGGPVRCSEPGDSMGQGFGCVVARMFLPLPTIACGDPMCCGDPTCCGDPMGCVGSTGVIGRMGCGGLRFAEDNVWRPRPQMGGGSATPCPDAYETWEISATGSSAGQGA